MQTSRKKRTGDREAGCLREAEPSMLIQMSKGHLSHPMPENGYMIVFVMIFVRKTLVVTGRTSALVGIDRCCSSLERQWMMEQICFTLKQITFQRSSGNLCTVAPYRTVNSKPYVNSTAMRNPLNPKNTFANLMKNLIIALVMVLLDRGVISLLRTEQGLATYSFLANVCIDI